jgi:hypothetical protein
MSEAEIESNYGTQQHRTLFTHIELQLGFSVLSTTAPKNYFSHSPREAR